MVVDAGTKAMRFSKDTARDVEMKRQRRNRMLGRRAAYKDIAHAINSPAKAEQLVNNCDEVHRLSCSAGGLHRREQV